MTQRDIDRGRIKCLLIGRGHPEGVLVEPWAQFVIMPGDVFATASLSGPTTQQYHHYEHVYTHRNPLRSVYQYVSTETSEWPRRTYAELVAAGEAMARVRKGD